MQKKNGSIIYSPSDLITFMSDPFSSWIDRLYLENPEGLVPDIPDDSATLVQKHGILHEQQFLEDLKNQHLDVCEIDGRDESAYEQTLEAMRAGRHVIYQGILRKDNFAGLSDFLIRTEGPSKLGEFHYEVWDSKLARKPKPYFLVQLCCYAEMLEVIQGCLPANIAVVLGNKITKHFRREDYYFYYLALKDRFLSFQQHFDSSNPPDCSTAGEHSKWTSVAEKMLVDRDDLLQVANIRKSQIKKLTEHGITTMAALATTQRDSLPGISQQTFIAMKAQARLQCASKQLDVPKFEIIVASETDTNSTKGLQLLPPGSRLDVYFDMEGYPYIEGGLEYLFGASHFEATNCLFKDWWAHNRFEEKLAFEEFVDWIYERFCHDPQMHVYHYGAYEVSALRRLSSRHATRELILDELLKAEVFVDLYAIVRQGVRIGCQSYSIKKVELLYMKKRKGDVAKATDSIVYYERWLENHDGDNWNSSAILRQIRDYNQLDCESTVLLCTWLRERQSENNILYKPKKNKASADYTRTLSENERLAGELLSEMPENPVENEEYFRVKQLLAHLLCFHRRESKVTWWEIFDRAGLSDEELLADPECIAFARRTAVLAGVHKKSLLFEYEFDPEQDLKLAIGDTVALSSDIGIKADIFELDEQNGKVVLKSTKEPPPEGHFLLFAAIKNAPLEKAILRQVVRFIRDGKLNNCLNDFLYREYPRLHGLTQGREIPDSLDSIKRLDNSYICVQGPPGTGKTYLAAKTIVQLIKEGKRVGVSSNSHKAIENLLETIGAEAARENLQFNGAKVGQDRTGAALKFSNPQIELCKDNKVLKALDDYQLIGATAWFFSREEMIGNLDYLFVDEAGQVCLANIVAMGDCANNLVLIGDQLQLDQPVKGSHPGESGESSLEYLLGDAATISPDRGIFLSVTRRMHPSLCSLVSSAVYDGRLHSDPSTEQRKIVLPPAARILQTNTGVMYLPVEHSGNSQSSRQEAGCIEQIVEELLHCQLITERGTKPMSLDDILIVAPYNKQVRLLQSRLPGARVGSVDKFQGRQAAAVIVSMCASDLANTPRGMEFLLSKKRLNVAISRAQLLAVIVGSPSLSQYVCSTVEQASLLNLYCRIMREGAKAHDVDACVIGATAT